MIPSVHHEQAMWRTKSAWRQKKKQHNGCYECPTLSTARHPGSLADQFLCDACCLHGLLTCIWSMYQSPNAPAIQGRITYAFANTSSQHDLSQLIPRSMHSYFYQIVHRYASFFSAVSLHCYGRSTLQSSQHTSHICKCEHNTDARRQNNRLRARDKLRHYKQTTEAWQ